MDQRQGFAKWSSVDDDDRLGPRPLDQRRSAFVERLLSRLRAIPITQPVARVRAEIRAQLAPRCDVIGARDPWIAATAVAHGYDVATADTADFRRVPGLRVVAMAIR